MHIKGWITNVNVIVILECIILPTFFHRMKPPPDLLQLSRSFVNNG